MMFDYLEAKTKIDQLFGENTGIIFGKDSDVPSIPSVSTGSILIDDALGIGGFPLGRIVEIYGLEMTGKTSLCLSTIANGQKNIDDKMFVFIDMEHSLSIQHAINLGVDINNLMIIQPNTGEECADIIQFLIEEIPTAIIVVDSIAGMIPKAILGGNIEEAHMGAHARLIGRMVTKSVPYLKYHNTLLLLINQIRHKPAVMFGSPEYTTGGNSIKFYASVRIDMRIKERKETYNIVKFSIKKNKVGTPYRTGEMKFSFFTGFDKGGELLSIGVSTGIIQRSGNWYSFNEQRLGQGKEASAEILFSNKELFDEILGLINEQRKNNKTILQDIQ